MQGTEFRATAADLRSGFNFDFPLEYAVLTLAMYGATGVASGEIAAYTYWCVEKGYPSFVGGDRDAAGWASRAKGWIRVVLTDVRVTLVILTCATLSSYQQPIALVIFGASFAAFMLPIQSFLTLYLQRRHLDARVRPRPWVTWMVALIFLAQTALSVMIVRNLLVYL